MRYVLLALLLFWLSGLRAADARAAGRSFEECRDLAIAHGVSPRYAASGKIGRHYLRYQAAGTAYHPRGLIARCMSGRN
jgi:hypothetical protein